MLRAAYSTGTANTTKDQQLKALSDVLDQHASLLALVERDFSKHDVAKTGARGLSLESFFRCLILKLTLRVSDNKA
jgi:hypothetical protein